MCLKEILMMTLIFNRYIYRSSILPSVYRYLVLVPYKNHKKIKNPIPPPLLLWLLTLHLAQKELHSQLLRSTPCSLTSACGPSP